MTQVDAHKKVLRLLESRLYTQIEISEIINVTRQTINSRVKNGKWRQKEIDIINTLG